MTDDRYKHLGLTGWPFNRAGHESGSVWIGRPEVQKRLKRLARGSSRVPASQLFLLWADLGAGKTHALRHLEWLAQEDPNLVTIMLTTPQGIGSFFDVYRSAIDGAIAVGALAAAGRDLMDKTIQGHVIGDVERAIIAIGTHREETARLAQAWLRGDPVQRQAAKEVGVTSHIRTSAEAIDAMSDLIRVLRRGERTVMLLVDEVQELGDLTAKKQAEAVGGLHKVFDKNPEGLTMVLSFTAAQQATMLNIIGGPLSDRSNDTITLPTITNEEAHDLVTGLLRHWATDPDGAPVPFEPEAIPAVIKALAEQSPDLSPRSVILAFDAILRDADFDIDGGEITSISSQYALEHLAGHGAGQS